MTESPVDSLPTITFDPMKGIPDDVLTRLGGTRVTLNDTQPRLFDPLGPVWLTGTSVEKCSATRELFGSTQTCGLEHHNDSRAHRMTNPDGSVITWRS